MVQIECLKYIFPTFKCVFIFGFTDTVYYLIISVFVLLFMKVIPAFMVKTTFTGIIIFIFLLAKTKS